MVVRVLIAPGGNRVMAVHSDASQTLLEGLGPIHIERLSDVEYNQDAGAWYVRWRDDHTLDGPFRLRSEALACETRHAEKHIRKEMP